TGRLRVQRDALLAGLRGHGLQVVTPPGGLVAWVDLGAPVADELVARLAPHGVLAAPGREFGSAHRHARFLRVPFTSDVGVLAQATERIARELEVVRRRKA
ncbi:MAG: aminotransferase class I/II-fold pyridoxal phosphate-dependent enzyme, partial [Ilumatobacteraceae bacterium]|nr:aminotransferase class I/II-fold pyridoxal phosphate-dependent enzyme [Ilumatobacteraceae bacterium]